MFFHAYLANWSLLTSVGHLQQLIFFCYYYELGFFSFPTLRYCTSGRHNPLGMSIFRASLCSKEAYNAVLSQLERWWVSSDSISLMVSILIISWFLTMNTIFMARMQNECALHCEENLSRRFLLFFSFSSALFPTFPSSGKTKSKNPYDETRLLEQNKRIQKENNAPDDFPNFVREGLCHEIVAIYLIFIENMTKFLN